MNGYTETQRAKSRYDCALADATNAEAEAETAWRQWQHAKEQACAYKHDHDEALKKAKKSRKALLISIAALAELDAEAPDGR